MTDAQRFILISGILNGALFLVAALVAGLMLHNEWAWKLAISDMGMVYLTSFYQLSGTPQRRIEIYLVVATIVLGFAAWGVLISGGFQ